MKKIVPPQNPKLAIWVVPPRSPFQIPVLRRMTGFQVETCLVNALERTRLAGLVRAQTFARKHK